VCVELSIITVGAKADLEERRQVTAAEGQALALELGTLWAETSSLSGRGGAAYFLFRALAVGQQLTSVGAVPEAFQLLAESVVLGKLHASAGGGWYIPDHQLLCQLYYNTTSPATTGCALQ
jgi:hypothetical protein